MHRLTPAHLLHTDRVHLTAFFAVLVAFALIGIDFSLVDTALAPGNPAAVIQPLAPGVVATSSAAQLTLYPYIEVVDSCGPYYNGDTCVNMRAGPGVGYPVVLQLRKGMVLKVSAMVVDDTGRSWYKLEPDTQLRYPERVTSEWYVAADLVQLVYDDGEHLLTASSTPTQKRIIVSRSRQMLYAYDGDALFMSLSISTGLELTPTPLGTYQVYKMTPSRYMQGPIPGLSDQVYDLPGVPWNLYFTQDGAVIHGAYWHDHFGQPWSHGCVNLPVEEAKKLYMWADIGTQVIVQE